VLKRPFKGIISPQSLLWYTLTKNCGNSRTKRKNRTLSNHSLIPTTTTEILDKEEIKALRATWSADEPDEAGKALGFDRQCTGFVKSSGRRCQRRPAPGRSTCLKHGGRAGRPIIHGKYSKYPTKAIKDAIEEFQNDPDLRNLNDEVIILRALIANIAENDGLVGMDKEGNPMIKHMTDLVDTLGKTIERSTKIETMEKGNLTLAQVDLMMRQVINILKTHCGACNNILNIAEDMQNINV
jgi:hypothetical protein